MSYIRDNERLDSGLPAIRRSAWDSGSSRLTTIENGYDHHHGGSYRYHSASRAERDAVLYPRPPSPNQGRRQNELQDQLRIYKEEMIKKDRLIAQLTSLETPRPAGFDTSKIDEMYSAERTHALATAKSELAAMTVKIEGLQSQVHEFQVQLEMRDEKNREMRLQLETARENEAKQSAMVSTLSHKLVEYEAAHGSLEGAASRSGLAIDSLQRENREQSQRVVELESRLRQYQEERERSVADRSVSDARLTELITKITSTLQLEDCCEPTQECIISRMTDIMQDNALLRGKLATMKEYVSNAELETKASRETIMRLVSEAEREQKEATRYNVDVTNLRLERDSALAKEQEFRQEIRILQERLDSSTRALAVTRQELEQIESRHSGLDHKLHSQEMAARSAEEQFRSFKESLAALLSDNYTSVTPFEEAIRERIQSLKLTSQDRSAYNTGMAMSSYNPRSVYAETHSRSTSPIRWGHGSGHRSRSVSPVRRLPPGESYQGYERSRSRSRSRSRLDEELAHSRPRSISPHCRHMSPMRHLSPHRHYDPAHVESLKRKIAELTSTLESQYDMQRNADRKSKMAESDILELQDRLQKAEQELAAGNYLRDGLRVDKERYLRFLERVSTALGMDPISSDLGFDSMVEAILGRAEQLIKMESDSLVSRKTHIYNLQRKIKSMKEQLESKDLHMDLLRKKCAAMEERLVGKTEAEREKDEEYIKNKKLLKLVEKYKRELNETRLEVRDLKARLLESTEIMNRTLHQEQELEVLESKVGQLEHVRSKQANKIAGLRETLECKSSEFEQKKEVVSNTVGALTSELRTTKAALNELTKRERQLLDLRQVIARMLGLDVTSLAVPDYEIISRLEKLILANQANATTAVVLDTALEDMEEGFRAGYDDASRNLARRTGTGTSMNKSGGYTRKQMGTRSRARSLSPSRKRDTRAY